MLTEAGRERIAQAQRERHQRERMQNNFKQEEEVNAQNTSRSILKAHAAYSNQLFHLVAERDGIPVHEVTARFLEDFYALESWRSRSGSESNRVYDLSATDSAKRARQTSMGANLRAVTLPKEKPWRDIIEPLIQERGGRASRKELAQWIVAHYPPRTFESARQTIEHLGRATSRWCYKDGQDLVLSSNGAQGAA
jgi:hypothetical protein